MRLALILVGLAIVLLAAWLYTPDLGRSALEKKYHVAATDYVDAAGIRLHLQDSGPHDAPAVILLHGFGSSLQTFDAWSDALSAKYRVVRYDLPGFGLTGPDPARDYSDARGIAILAALMDKLGIHRADIVGNSMGGKLAWQFAATYPARVDHLVLISPDGFASPGFDYGKAPAIPLMLRALPYTLPTPMLRMSIAPAYADAAHLTPATVERYRDMMRAPGVRGAILDRTAQTILQDPERQLRSIQAPTLLIWGEQDGMIPFGNSADYMRLIAHCTLAKLPGLGHVPQEEAPRRSLAILTSFLEGHVSQP